MKITLKNVKVHDELSEETNCFSATMYVNGVKAGLVSNRGCGSCHDYSWVSNSTRDRVLAWVETQKFEFDFDKLDQLIDQALERQYAISQLQKLTKKNTLFRLKGDKSGEWRSVKSPYRPQVEEHLKGKYQDQLEHVVVPSNLEAALPFSGVNA